MVFLTFVPRRSRSSKVDKCSVNLLRLLLIPTKSLIIVHSQAAAILLDQATAILTPHNFSHQPVVVLVHDWHASCFLSKLSSSDWGEPKHGFEVVWYWTASANWDRLCQIQKCLSQFEVLLGKLGDQFRTEVQGGRWSSTWRNRQGADEEEESQPHTHELQRRTLPPKSRALSPGLRCLGQNRSSGKS